MFLTFVIRISPVTNFINHQNPMRTAVIFLIIKMFQWGIYSSLLGEVYSNYSIAETWFVTSVVNYVVCTPS